MFEICFKLKRFLFRHQIKQQTEKIDAVVAKTNQIDLQIRTIKSDVLSLHLMVLLWPLLIPFVWFPYPGYVTNPRGLGLFCAFDMPSGIERDKLISKLYENKLLILGSGDQSVRFRPHLNVTEDDINFGMDCFRRALNKLS